MKQNKNNVFGFTLIELLVVIAIIGLLSSVILVALSNSKVKSRDAKRIADMQQIRTALELYYQDNGYYPPSKCGWDCNDYNLSLIPADWNGLQTQLAPYLPTLPIDPVNNTTRCAYANTIPIYDGCYAYAYGNVGRYANPAQYDLFTQFEDPNQPLRCALKGYVWYFNRTPWCGSFSPLIYEVSPR